MRLRSRYRVSNEFLMRLWSESRLYYNHGKPVIFGGKKPNEGKLGWRGTLV